jgi:hypothetical protein
VHAPPPGASGRYGCPRSRKRSCPNCRRRSKWVAPVAPPRMRLWSHLTTLGPSCALRVCQSQGTWCLRSQTRLSRNRSTISSWPAAI